MKKSAQRMCPRKSLTNESTQPQKRKRGKSSVSSALVKKPRMKKEQEASPTLSSTISTPMSDTASTMSSNTLINSISACNDQTNSLTFLQSSNNFDFGQAVAYPVVSLANQCVPTQSLDPIPPPLLNPLDSASEIFDDTIAPFIHANNETLLVIKTRLYRHMFLTHTKKAILEFYPHGINIADLILLALEVMKTIGLF